MIDKWVLSKILAALLSAIITSFVVIIGLLKTPSDHFLILMSFGIFIVIFSLLIEASVWKHCLPFKPYIWLIVRCVSDENTYRIQLDKGIRHRYVGRTFDNYLITKAGEHTLSVYYQNMCQQSHFKVNEIKKVNVSITGDSITIDEKDEYFDRDPQSMVKKEKQSLLLFITLCIIMMVGGSLTYVGNLIRFGVI